MSSNKKDEILTRFIGITQCPSDVAREYLEAVEWNEQVAVDIFFDNTASEPRAPVPPTKTRSVPTRAHHQASEPSASGGTNPYESDDDLLQSVLEESLRLKPVDKPPAVFPKRTNEHKSIVSSKINTVDTSRHNGDDSDGDQGQAFYAGGSERSGQQILGPSKGKDNHKKISGVFEAARRQGATEDHDDQSTSSSHTKKEKPFGGAGYSLGDEKIPSRTQGQPPTRATAAPAAVPNKEENLLIRFYSNGFTVGDGELRKFEENKEFVDYIKRGEVPPELRNMNSNGQQVKVSLEDHRNEEHKRVAPAFKPFGGAGHTVGMSGSSQVPTRPSVASSMTTISDSLDAHHLEQLASKRLRTSLTSSTTIRLRLPDVSTPLCIHIDLNRTLADVRKFLNENVPSLQSNTFEFLEPPATKIKRDDERKKIGDAKLSNSTLAVRRLA